MEPDPTDAWRRFLERHGKVLCERCKCCEMLWQECEECEDGVYDVLSDDSGIYEPAQCSTCEGRGGFYTCDCNDEGEHTSLFV